MTRCIAALCVVVMALVPACSRNKPPDSLFDTAGYHVRGDRVYYLNAFPGNAFQIVGADAASFHDFDPTYARDKTTVYFDGQPIPDADASSFQVLDRPGFAKDRKHVFALDRVISDDPAHFELLDASMSKDAAHIYWSDGTVLSDDPAHFVIVSNTEHYLFTKDGRTVHVNGNPIAGADPATFRVLGGAYSQDRQRIYYFTESVADVDAASFRALEGPYAVDARRAYWMGQAIGGANPATFHVLNAAFECSADAEHAYYRQSVIPRIDPHSFPRGRDVTGCTETSISFAE
jgi:hypothetical protein